MVDFRRTQYIPELGLNYNVCGFLLGRCENEFYYWQNTGNGVIDTEGNKLVFIYEPNWYPFPFLEGSIVDSKHLIKIIESVIWKSSGRFERGKDGHSSHLDHFNEPLSRNSL